MGPVAAKVTIAITASRNTPDFQVVEETLCANLENLRLMFMREPTLVPLNGGLADWTLITRLIVHCSSPWTVSHATDCTSQGACQRITHANTRVSVAEGNAICLIGDSMRALCTPAAGLGIADSCPRSNSLDAALNRLREFLR